jgi:hypothetical protein
MTLAQSCRTHYHIVYTFKYFKLLKVGIDHGMLVIIAPFFGLNCIASNKSLSCVKSKK